MARAGRGRVPTINLLFDLYPEALVQALGGVAALAKTCLDELTRLALHPTIPVTAQEVSAHLTRLAAATDTAEQADQASGS